MTPIALTIHHIVHEVDDAGQSTDYGLILHGVKWLISSMTRTLSSGQIA